MSRSGPPVLPPVAVWPGFGKVAVTPLVPRLTIVQAVLLDRGVGERVRPGVAEDLVVAEAGDDRVVAIVAEDLGAVRGSGAAAADQAVVAPAPRT